MECVHYSIKIISSPNIRVEMLYQEVVLGPIGELGICLSQVSSSAWTQRPLVQF